MRFASRFKNYRHGVRRGREMILADGQRQVLQTELRAVFTPAKLILTEEEVQQAIKGMVHMGLPFDRDKEELFSPRSRISGFDSIQAQELNDWTDDERKLVEKALLTSPHFGSDHIELVKEPALIPWPTYDGDDPERIVMIAQATGLVAAVLEYEAENLARPEVLEGFEDEPVEQTVTLDAS